MRRWWLRLVATSIGLGFVWLTMVLVCLLETSVMWTGASLQAVDGDALKHQRVGRVGLGFQLDEAGWLPWRIDASFEMS